jgi:hypothetical protein
MMPSFLPYDSVIRYDTNHKELFRFGLMNVPLSALRHVAPEKPMSPKKESVTSFKKESVTSFKKESVTSFKKESVTSFKKESVTSFKKEKKDEKENKVLVLDLPKKFRRLFPMNAQGETTAWRHGSLRRSQVGANIDNKDVDSHLNGAMFQSRYCIITNFHIDDDARVECIPFKDATGIPSPTIVEDAASCFLPRPPFAIQPISIWIPCTFRLILYSPPISK